MIPISKYWVTYLQVWYSKPLWSNLPVHFLTLALKTTHLLSFSDILMNELVLVLIDLKQLRAIILLFLEQNLIH